RARGRPTLHPSRASGERSRAVARRSDEDDRRADAGRAQARPRRFRDRERLGSRLAGTPGGAALDDARAAGSGLRWRTSAAAELLNRFPTEAPDRADSDGPATRTESHHARRAQRPTGARRPPEPLPGTSSFTQSGE